MLVPVFFAELGHQLVVLPQILVGLILRRMTSHRMLKTVSGILLNLREIHLLIVYQNLNLANLGRLEFIWFAKQNIFALHLQ